MILLGQKREINGDLPLRRKDRTRYRMRAWIDFLGHFLERDVSEAVHMDKAFIHTKIMTYGKGGKLASPQRIQFRWLARFLQEYTKGRVINVLDIGCGSGNYCDIFSEAALGSTYLGIDVATNENWLVLRESRNPTVDFLVMDVRDIDCLAQKYDLVVSFSALEHFESVEEVLKKSLEIQVPGGECLHAVPSHWSYFHYGLHGWRRFSSGSLRTLFESAGYRIVQTYRMGGPFAFALYGFTRLIMPNCLRMREVGLTMYQKAIEAAIYLDQFIPWPPLTYIVHAKKDAVYA